MKKRLLPALLALVMILAMLPMAVFADGTDDTVSFGGFSDTPENWLRDAITQTEKLKQAHTGTEFTLTSADFENTAAFKNAALNYNGVQACIAQNKYDGVNSYAATEGKDAISDVSQALSDLKAYYESITSITATNAGLTNVDFLQAFTKVTSLNVSGNTNLANLDGVAYCTELETLNIEDCTSITNLNALAGVKNEDGEFDAPLTSLTTLKAANCGLKDDDQTGDPINGITGLAYCSGLKTLDISGNEDITRLDALSGDAAHGQSALELESLTASGLTLSSVGDPDVIAGIENLNLGTDDDATKLLVTDDNQDAMGAVVRALEEKGTTIGLTNEDGEDVATYTVTAATADNVTVEVDKATAIAGETITVTATAGAGYAVDEIKVVHTADDTTTVTVNNGKFTMPAANVTVSATVKSALLVPHAITVTSPENGTVKVTKKGESTEVTEALVNDIVTITATPSTNYVVASVTAKFTHPTSGEEVERKLTANEDGTYDFMMYSVPVTFTVTFMKDIKCLYVEGTPVPIDPDDENTLYYYEDSIYGGLLKLSNLDENSKYVIQLAKAGAYNVGNCTILVFETGNGVTTKDVEVLPSADGYTVSLYKYTSNDISDIRGLETTTLNKTTVTAD